MGFPNRAERGRNFSKCFHHFENQEPPFIYPEEAKFLGGDAWLTIHQQASTEGSVRTMQYNKPWLV